jgi:hypothetical protein
MPFTSVLYWPQALQNTQTFLDLPGGLVSLGSGCWVLLPREVGPYPHLLSTVLEPELELSQLL